MNALWFELRQTLRGFAARPLFVAVTVLTLALGIGANAAIFTAVDALLLKRLPYPDPQQLVMLWSDGTQRGFARQDVVNPGVMKEWERSMTTVQSVAAFNFWDSTLATEQGATLIQGAEVSERYFATLGVPLLLGRGFTPEEDQENGPRVVVVSHVFWQREFAGDPGVLGRSVELNRETWTVIGGGLRLVAGGVALGILFSLAIGGILETLLFEVEPFDLQVFAAVSLLLIVTAMAAMLIPARRAARVHPMEALRYE